LRDLTQRAGLHKKRLAFSFLFMEKAADAGPATRDARPSCIRSATDGSAKDAARPSDRRSIHPSERRANSGKDAGEPDAPTELRVLSDPIAVPGENAPARYACSEKGLALLADARHIPSLAIVRASVRKDASGGIMRDAKSGLPVYAITENPPRKATAPRKGTLGEIRDGAGTPPGKAALRKGNIKETRDAVVTPPGKAATPRKGNNRR
jgi:hypothetical protein